MRNLLFIILLAPVLLAAQPRNNIYQDLIWIRYYHSLNLRKGWSVHAEIESRNYLTEFRRHQWFLPRTRLNYAWKWGSAAAGFVFFPIAMPQEAASDIDITVPEFREYQQFVTKLKVRRFSLSHRFMWELRWRRRNDGVTLREGFDFRHRFRFQPKVTAKIWSSADGKIQVSSTIGDEFMFHVESGRYVFDQNRIFAGLSLGWQKMSISLDYLNWYQPRPDKVYRRDIFRLTYRQTMALKKPD